MDKTLIKVHLVWSVGVLLAAIIAILSDKPDANEIISFVSFAAAISSLILAVVAIFYTMISNNSFEKTLSDIRVTAAKIVDETSNLRSASAGLSAEAEEIIRHLAGLPKELSNLSGKIDNKFDDVLSFKKIDSGLNDGEATAADVFQPGGKPLPLTVTLYAMYLSEKLGKTIRIEEVFANEGDNNRFRDFMVGMLVSLKFSNTYGIELDGILDTFVVNTLGTLDLKVLADNVENGLPKDDPILLRYFNAVRRSMDLDEIAIPDSSSGK